VKIKKPIQCSAPTYVELLFVWVENQVDDERLFPQSSDTFPDDFLVAVRKIFTRLFRVYAHIYHSHFSYVFPNHHVPPLRLPIQDVNHFRLLQSDKS
jgi:MOB kinase activator 1